MHGYGLSCCRLLRLEVEPSGRRLRAALDVPVPRRPGPPEGDRPAPRILLALDEVPAAGFEAGAGT
ncbi:hypothetical protein [Kitasatospora sp. NPDC015120]|uniref:hypothetical protein n=1 Tax=Kitasatospora sp. NPDC015120 TaxID=3364023 RepID=UPI0036F4ABB8